MLVRGTGGTVTDHDRLIAGRYRLGEQIGVGAMGIVWRARDERLRRTVAVKQLLLQPGLDERQAAEARARAMREARIAARLQHQNVVIVYDVVEDGGAPWLIMEYVPSRSLAMVMRESGPLPPYQVADIGAQAAAGLAAAHANGVIHRDVKPGNVLLGDDGTVKITDFGISRAVDDAVLTATGLITGTPAYLAPELAKGGEPAPSSDVFALGSTLYAAVQGAPPFGFNENPLALLYIVANGTVSPPPNGGPLTPVLMRLLGTDPHDRPTMRQVHVDRYATVDVGRDACKVARVRIRSDISQVEVAELGAVRQVRGRAWRLRLRHQREAENGCCNQKLCCPKHKSPPCTLRRWSSKTPETGLQRDSYGVRNRP